MSPSRRKTSGGASGAGTSGAALDLSSLDPAQPQAFYLPSTFMEPLSDCFAVVQGVRLPLHSQILSAQSAVLQDLFLAQHEGGGAAAKEAAPDLSAAFGGSSVEAAACFLRLSYRGHEISPASFAALSTAGHLAGVAELAHKLNAVVMLRGLEAYLQDQSTSLPAKAASVPRLLCALRLSQTCQLSTIEDRCLTAVADSLAAGGRASISSKAAELATLDSGTLVTLMHAVVERAQQGACWTSRILEVCARSNDKIAGGFTCALEGFSKLDLKPGCWVNSPWVEVGGYKWRLQVFPKGNHECKNTHLSAYLELDGKHAKASGTRAVTASYSITAEDQLPERGIFQDHIRGETYGPEDTFDAERSWGWANFMTMKQLKGTRYLAHDRLLLRVGIRITGTQRVGRRRQ